MNDPVKGCDVYKNIGCAHVDGFLCDYPNCSILKDYRMNERIKELIEYSGATVLIHKTMTGSNQYTFLEDDLERFFKFIIQETIAEMTEPIEEKEFDVVIDALQERYDRLWKMTKRNMESEYVGMNIMDDIRLKQMEQLDQAIKLRKQHFGVKE